MKRKTSPSPLSRATEPRPLAAAPSPGNESKSAYASVLARARALGLYAVVTIAPLGLAGSVAACGAARPVERSPHYQPGEPVPPMESIAPPPAAPSSSAPAPVQNE